MRKTARFLCALCISVILVFCCIPQVSAAGKPIAVTVNGTKLKLKHQPRIVNKTVMLPAQEVLESLGADTDWIKKDRLLLVTRGSQMISLKAGSKKMYTSDLLSEENKTITLKRAPKVIGGTVYISAQAAAKATGAKVKWNSKKRKVTIEIM